MQNLSELYNRDYFEQGIQKNISLYENYRWLPEYTLPFAFRIIEELDLKKDDTILDYGCGKGYLVKALRLLYRRAWGTDISSYAISNAPDDVKPYVYCVDYISLFGDKKYNWIIAKDVLEHISYENIDKVLDNFVYTGENLFAIIPLGDGNKYVLKKNERDVTHYIRESLQWWKNKFMEVGYSIKKATYNVAGMKQMDQVDKEGQQTYGNGFFIMENKEVK